MMRDRFLMCPPDHYGVEYVINPWMDGNIGRVDRAAARVQWEALHSALSARAQVDLLTPVAGLPDMVFTANGGLAGNGTFFPSSFYYRQRAGEVAHHVAWFEQAGQEIAAPGHPAAFEGEGDALFQPGERLLWAGYGVRSSLEAHRNLADAFTCEVVSLRLIDERFYHLDTCFCALPGGRAFYFPEAFDLESLAALRGRFAPENRIEVSPEDALAFACNAVLAGGVLHLNHASQALEEGLSAWGIGVERIPLTQFILAGGAAKCLSLRVRNELPSVPADLASAGPRTQVAGRVLHIEGHILDTGLMNTLLDVITEAGGSFEIEHFQAGLRRDMTSSARIRVLAPTASRLDDLCARLLQMGATVVEGERDARLEPVLRDGVAPDDFYSTTIYPTEVRVGGQWLRSERQRMDAAFIVSGLPDAPRLEVKLFRDLRAGELVVCGVDGIRIHAARGQKQGDDFAFMSSGVSSERRVELSVEQIAWEMERIRAREGRIVVVAGPVVIHTGGGVHLAGLIRSGYVQSLLGGNAIAAHDIESALYGTSLGVDLKRGIGVHEGHRHHLRAINLVRKAGSIRAAVESGLVTGGIMYECVQRGIPYVLAGSIRDDGPLPDTIMDLEVAQAAYAREVRGADMILMLSSMLHSIGVGNMTPSGVKLICVDISPAVVTKLADRGSLESVGVVTDVGLFLNLLAARLLK